MFIIVSLLKDGVEFMFPIGIIFIGIGVSLMCDASYHKGIEEGAYNQLRNNYEVQYIIDKDSCVVDTIIKL